ncbi:MAG: hypothetical protein BECKG1743D_GA0114223_106063 [Candidatus Kentron sp. G]|nr:MAG: hypothetical protein BECKG1743F_GA0114225_105863 [Candidatus Kentron sp. G]VFN02661.1 MAG: hypothetical protein BECKG1743E_GA0114224_105303 [Candidatus Kentron sp. G]VFN04572.1 MAG: hypothetical protein BECKG1743D_GA0114223_106063 [Candidatus Kentron sp. G]
MLVEPRAHIEIRKLSLRSRVSRVRVIIFQEDISDTARLDRFPVGFSDPTEEL